MTTELNLQQSQISLKEQHKLREQLAAKKDVDYSKHQLGATTLPARGHLVNDPFWKAPVVFADDTFQNIKNIGKGLKGEGSDQNLGNMNDVGMKAGGLAIAGYLATKRIIPAKKGMEFVGFGAFLASMALWPKAFIQAPIQAMYGFNFNQQYVDSYGRKKYLNRDPQYTPDLYSPEQLKKIGDRMGIDPNMENRQALVKEKMNKISTQANTLWMLTAGVAVPVMCSLLSSQAEKLLNYGHKEVKTNIEDSKLDKLFQELQNPTQNASVERNKVLDSLLDSNQDQVVDNKFIDRVTQVLVGSEDYKLKEHMTSDLTDLMQSHQVNDVAEHLGDMEISAVLSGNKSGSAKSIGFEIDKAQIKQRLQEKKLNDKILIGGPGSEENVAQIRNILTEMITENPVFQNSSRAERKAMNASATAILQNKLQTPSMVLTKSKREAIHEAYEHLTRFRKGASVIHSYVLHKVGDKEDAVVAREWQKATNGIFKALGFTTKDYEAAKDSPIRARDILEGKFSAIAKDDKKYEETVRTIANIVNKFEEQLYKGTIKDKDGKVAKSFTEGVKDVTRTVYGTLGEKLATSSSTSGRFTRTVTYISGYSKEGYEQAKADVFPGTAAHNVVIACEQRSLGARNGLRKVLHALDVHKRIQSGEVKESLKKRGRTDEAYVEKVTSVMKYALAEGTLGSHVVKFDIPQREVYKDAMIELFCMDKNHVGEITKGMFAEGFSPEAGKIESVNMDKYIAQFPEAVDMHPLTKSVLGTKYEGFRSSLADVADRTVNVVYRFKRTHTFLTSDVISVKDPGHCNWALDQMKQYQAKHATPGERLMSVSDTLARITGNNADQVSNTKISSKFMLIGGAAVAAVTLVAPLFFGKVKAPQQQQNKKGVEANV